ncbi:protein kinase [Nocardioides sp. NPDC047086]|uniref:protein kinase domain-containing protein n=1 Tax=Nocardioides sp. NPDC047086 TaxID=3154810 RepID=UPI0033D7304A
MGRVWRATDTQSRREVAIKVLADGHRPDQVARFDREGRAAGIDHDHVVRIHHVEPAAQDLDAHIVMEILPGPTLRGMIVKRGALPATEAAAMFAPVADALSVVHQAGFVHRDLKPSNLMFDRKRRLKLLDFGIAYLTAEEHVRLTASNEVVGSAPYMSPEQAGGKPVGAASDIYSLGCILFEVLSGHQPFTEGNRSEMVVQRLTIEAPYLGERIDGPTEAIELVTGMMMRRPEDRPSATEVRERLYAIAARQARPSYIGAAANEAAMPPPTRSFTRPRRRRTGVLSTVRSEPFATASDRFRYPEVLDVEDVREILVSWAGRRRWLAQTYFDEVPLTVERTERVSQFRLAQIVTKATRIQHAEPRLPTFETTTGKPALPPPTSLEVETRHFLVQPSSQSRCRKCWGAKKVSCPKTVACDRCHGSGRKDGDRGARDRRVGVCQRCDGRGRTPCPDCGQEGKKRCDKCEGTGKLFTFTELVLERGPIYSAPARVSALRWPPVLDRHFGPEQRVPVTYDSGLTENELAAIDNLTRRARPAEACAIQGRFAAITKATYELNHKQRSAWLLGDRHDPRVLAPWLQARLLAYDAAIVVGLIAIVVIVSLLNS